MEPTPVSPKTMNPMPWVVLGIVVILAAAGMWYVLTQNANTNENTNVAVGNSNRNANVNTANTNTKIDTSGWMTYQDSATGLSFKYPKDWTRIGKMSTGSSFAQVYIDTYPDFIAVNPDYYQEPWPLVKVFTGETTSKVIDWLNAWQNSASYPFQTKESGVELIPGKSGLVVSNNYGDYPTEYLIVEYTSHILLIQLPDTLMKERGVYLEIIKTITI